MLLMGVAGLPARGADSCMQETGLCGDRPSGMVIRSWVLGPGSWFHCSGMVIRSWVLGPGFTVLAYYYQGSIIELAEINT